jgi:hypothetical protein
MYSKGKSCYKYIINEYEKMRNLNEKNVELYSDELITEIKKIFFNQINCYLKLQNTFKAEEYINKVQIY